jgi:putative DNA methylase
MAVFSRYAKVIEADGSQMRVRSALQLINQALDEVLSEQETEYDADTQWAVAWFTDQGMAEGAFGIAETLSKAKNTSVDGLVESGLLSAAKGKVRLIPREQLDTEWDPTTDRRLTIWEVAQHLIARLKSAGEQSAADLLRRVGGMGEIARDLAYRLYSVCERKGWTEEAIAYNSLVVAWPEITRLASQAPSARQGEQMSLG